MKKFSLTDLLISVVTAELVGTVSALVAGNFQTFYSQIIKPPLSPPAIVFPVVWTFLYALMGISAFIVKNQKSGSLKIYAIQLAVNFLWSIIFFRFRMFGLSAITAVILMVLVGIMVLQFFKVSKISAVLNIPYLLWSVFATYLAVSIYIIN